MDYFKWIGGRDMSLEEMKRIVAKEFGIESISSPFGSCTEEFLNNKILEVAVKNNFPANIIERFKKNPYKFGKYQKFDNGRSGGKCFITLLDA